MAEKAAPFQENSSSDGSSQRFALAQTQGPSLAEPLNLALCRPFNWCDTTTQPNRTRQTKCFTHAAIRCQSAKWYEVNGLTNGRPRTVFSPDGHGETASWAEKHLSSRLSPTHLFMMNGSRSDSREAPFALDPVGSTSDGRGRSLRHHQLTNNNNNNNNESS